MEKSILTLFGHPRLLRGEQQIDIRRRKALALLTFLAVKQTPQSREALATLFWPEHDQSQALANLRREMARLKRDVGELLAADRKQLQINPELELEVDVIEFRAKLQQGDVLSITAAADLYQDQFMAGFTLPDCPEFDDWQYFLRENLREQLAQCLQKLITYHTQQQTYTTALPYVRRWVNLDSLHEPAQRELMRLLALSKQHTAALRQYEECVNLLEEELGVEPEEETTALWEAIRAKEMGELSESEIDLLPAVAAPALRHNIPAQTTSFIGRDEEQAAVRQRLLSEEIRLVTLSGIGGIGKTRLGLAVAETFLPDGDNLFPDGLFFVPLMALNTADDIPIAVAEALGVTIGTAEPREFVRNYVRDKAMLLLFDNFEQRLDGVSFVQEILQAGANVKCLAMSRERLKLSGEHVYLLSGLTIDSENPAQSSAAQLLLERGHVAHIDPQLTEVDLEAVVQIARQLQGMPLALVLAAGWRDLLTWPEIASEINQSLDFLESELQDMPERQRSIRAVFDRSWDILSAADQHLFAKLSVFRSGFTRQAAQRIAGASMRQLSTLLGKSLLYRRHDGRYEIHELLRQYAWERLTTLVNQPQEVTDIHSRFYSEFVRSLYNALRGAEQQEALRQMGQEIENIRAAWRWAVDHLTHEVDQLRHLERFVIPLFHYHDIRSQFRAGEEAFRGAVEKLRPLAEPEAHPAALALLGKIMGRQGWFVFHLGGYQQARELLEQSLTLLEAADDIAESSFTHNYLGAICRHLGENQLARTHLEQGLAIARETQDSFRMSIALNILGQIAYMEGDYEAARRICEESLAIKRQIGDRRGMVYSLNYTGRVALAQGAYDEAQQLFSESLAISEALGDGRSVAISQCNLADLKHVQGAEGEATVLYTQSLATFEEVVDKIGILTAQTRLGDLARINGQQAEAWERFAIALNIASGLEIAPPVLELLVSVAELRHEQTQAKAAATIAQAVLDHQEPASWYVNAHGRSMRSCVKSFRQTILQLLQ